MTKHVFLTFLAFFLFCGHICDHICDLCSWGPGSMSWTSSVLRCCGDPRCCAMIRVLAPFGVVAVLSAFLRCCGDMVIRVDTSDQITNMTPGTSDQITNMIANITARTRMNATPQIPVRSQRTPRPSAPRRSASTFDVRRSTFDVRGL